MTREQILELFQKTGALQKGHFVLTSGLHSDTYFQCALVLQHPRYAEQLCNLGKIHFANERIDTVIAPAVGGIVVGYELARQLGARSIFAERQEGQMTLRRGFEIHRGEKVVIAEDVITTGGSVAEVLALVQARQARVPGIFAIVDRSGGQVRFGVPFHSAITLQAQVYPPAECPLCQQGLPICKPGSRQLR